MRCLDAVAAARARARRGRERGARARQRLRRRLGRGGADARRGRRADRARAPPRQGAQRQRADGALARALLPAAERGFASCCPAPRRALYDALESDPRAACAVAALRRADGAPQASAWRFPGVGAALAGAADAGARVQRAEHRRARCAASTGASRRRSLVRREAAEQVGWMDGDFFVYSDEVDFQKRLADAGWHTLYVPAAVAIHHEQLSTGAAAAPRIVEHARGRDRYMRKHHGAAAAALAVRWLTAWAYGLRALAALVLPGPRRAPLPRACASRRCVRRAARVCARRPRATTPRARPSAERAGAIHAAAAATLRRTRPATCARRAPLRGAEEAGQRAAAARSCTTRAPRSRNPAAPVVGSASSPATDTPTSTREQPRRGAPTRSRR